MKKFSVLSLLTLSLVSFNLFSQDAAITRMVYPVPNQNVHLQYTYDIIYVLKVAGSTPVPANTGYNFTLLYDGISQGVFTYGNHPKMNPGDSVELTIQNQAISTPNSTIDVCVVVDLAGDNNTSNDTVCNTLNFSIDDNYDIGPSHIDIFAPKVDSLIEVGEDIYVLQVSFSSYGTVTVPREDTIRFETKIYNDTRGPFTGITETALDNTNTFSALAGGQQSKVQNTPGPFQICATLINKPEDKNPSNDEYCQIFFAYDYTNITEHEKEDWEAYAHQKTLYLSNSSDDVNRNELRIYTNSGQLVDSRMITNEPKGVVNLSHLPSGIYVLQILNEEGLLYSKRFAID